MESLINLIPFILGALCLGVGLALYFRSMEAKNLWHMVNELEQEIDSQAKDWKRINSELLAEAKRWKEMATAPKLGADMPRPILIDRQDMQRLSSRTIVYQGADIEMAKREFLKHLERYIYSELKNDGYDSPTKEYYQEIYVSKTTNLHFNNGKKNNPK